MIKLNKEVHGLKAVLFCTKKVPKEIKGNQRKGEKVYSGFFFNFIEVQLIKKIITCYCYII